MSSRTIVVNGKSAVIKLVITIIHCHTLVKFKIIPFVRFINDKWQIIDIAP